MVRIHLLNHCQNSDDDCGPASSFAVLRYYGIGPRIYANWLKKLKCRNPEITCAVNIKLMLKSLGLNAVSRHNMSFVELKHHIDLGRPVICAIQAWGKPDDYRRLASGHYVTAIGYDNRYIYFQDPSICGARGYMSISKFVSRWYDKSVSGRYYNRYGMVVWSNLLTIKPNKLSKMREIA